MLTSTKNPRVAAAARLKKEGLNPIPEIMIPLVGTRNEMALERERLEGVEARLCGSGRALHHNGVGLAVPRQEHRDHQPQRRNCRQALLGLHRPPRMREPCHRFCCLRESVSRVLFLV